VPLFDPDGSHPSVFGSTLAACVFVARLFDCQPVTLGLRDMSTAQKKLLDQATRAAVKRAS
jgi:hypothetical protein